MWNELGISGGTAIVILIALYFVIKWAVKNGIKEAYSAITGKKTVEDIQNLPVDSGFRCGRSVSSSHPSRFRSCRLR